MTRSIFDPGGGETERSGSTFRPQEADDRSHLPSDVADGDVSSLEAREADAVAAADAAGLGPDQRIAAIPPDAPPDENNQSEKLRPDA